jgi:hypothetical protein
MNRIVDYLLWPTSPLVRRGDHREAVEGFVDERATTAPARADA